MATVLSSCACSSVARAPSVDNVSRRSHPAALTIRASARSSLEQDSEPRAARPVGGARLPAHLAALTAAALLLASSPCPVLAEDAGPAFKQYFGTAASASSYGGYGGNANKRDTAEYVYDVPDGWKERLISKVEKGTNGTDSEFFNPRRKSEKVYVTFLSGFRRLAARDSVLGNLALSDVNLQDIIASAESIESFDRKDPSGQLYYDFEIDSPVAHSLISVTCAKNKLYAHFVNAPSNDWSKDAPMLRHIHQSFTTVGDTPLEAAF
ncbi:hypothetical protein GOP47_0004604 [Adiantum capillus-veneris]|uniref:PsbP C-terminal domain-containing protein n=1 Tax=Adiantum capillus-veneris TaxID=13818 RepID=A0A9D4V7R7_ADICA|nr:hypothetical protein GOP47_0004604 [Adiantum capillus-veneris]